MRILITGGTGFIGSYLCRTLLQANHQLVVLSRYPETVIQKCGKGVEAISSIDELDVDAQIDTIINLAGEPVIAKRWSEKRKQNLLDSRLVPTQALVDFIARVEKKPRCLISGSAIGFYGDGGEQILDETSSYHDEFSHELCRQWEGAAQQAEKYGVRVCLVRIGLVVGAGGGFLQQMLTPFKFGLGGPIGKGSQWMSWIHIKDLVDLLIWLLQNDSVSGVFNGTAPNPVTNHEFAKTLGRSLGRPAVIPMPSFVLQAAMGEMSQLLLTGQRVMPMRALEAGFDFKYKDLDGALEHVLSA